MPSEPRRMDFERILRGLRELAERFASDPDDALPQACTDAGRLLADAHASGVNPLPDGTGLPEMLRQAGAFGVAPPTARNLFAMVWTAFVIAVEHKAIGFDEPYAGPTTFDALDAAERLTPNADGVAGPFVPAAGVTAVQRRAWRSICQWLADNIESQMPGPASRPAEPPATAIAAGGDAAPAPRRRRTPYETAVARRATGLFKANTQAHQLLKLLCERGSPIPFTELATDPVICGMDDSRFSGIQRRVNAVLAAHKIPVKLSRTANCATLTRRTVEKPRKNTGKTRRPKAAKKH